MMKKLLITAVVLGAGLTGTAFATCPGFYVGAQAGVVHNNYSDDDLGINSQQLTNVFGGTVTSSSTSIDNTVFGATGFVGYQFNPYFATEIGYIYSNNIDYNGSAIGQDAFGRPDSFNVTNGEIQTQAGDLLLKGILPIADGFSLNAKAGAAWVYAKNSATVSVTDAGVTAGGSASGSTDPLRPAVGGGASYSITPNLDVDVSYLRIVGNSSLADYDLYSAGLSYYFG